MFNLFYKIWDLTMPPLETGGRFNIQSSGTLKEFNSYDKSYSVFGIVNPENHLITRYHNCREIIGTRINEEALAHPKTNVFIVFKAYQMNIEQVSLFFAYINQRMGVGKEIKWYRTNIEDTIVIDASVFWFESFYRHAMLTLFIRMGCVHYKGDFEQAIKNYVLASRVIPVIEMFLEGFVSEKYTNINGDYGVVQLYKELSRETLEASYLKKEA